LLRRTLSRFVSWLLFFQPSPIPSSRDRHVFHQFADFVQEQGPAVGKLELAGPVVPRPGAGPFDIA
jgi:hypothetical protein